VKLGAKVFGLLSGILVVYLLVGLLLPRSWRAEADSLVPAPPSSVFPLVNRLSSWASWTHVPETGLEAFGPPTGVGAGVRWDDPRYGAGEVRIVGSEEDRMVEYEVIVENGALTIHGSITLEPEGVGTRVRWVEEGDFGWNPLLGYAARGMSSSQAETMRQSLRMLSEEVQTHRSGSGGAGPMRGI
jgi:hypothetical protein